MKIGVLSEKVEDRPLLYPNHLIVPKFEGVLSTKHKSAFTSII